MKETEVIPSENTVCCTEPAGVREGILALFGEKNFLADPTFVRTAVGEDSYYSGDPYSYSVYTKSLQFDSLPEKYKEKLSLLYNRISEKSNGVLVVEPRGSYDFSFRLSVCYCDYNYILTAYVMAFGKMINCKRIEVSLDGSLLPGVEYLKEFLRRRYTTGRAVNRICTYLKNVLLYDNLLHWPGWSRLPEPIEALPEHIRRDRTVLVPYDTLRIGELSFHRWDYNQRQMTHISMPVDWIVLEVDVENNRALVVSQKVLPAYTKIIDKTKTVYRWSESPLNRWLNSGFISSCSLGKVPMVNVPHTTEAGRSETRSPEEITDEKIFLLSKKETERYFPMKYGLKGPIASPVVDDGRRGVSWQLRTPYSSSRTYIVSYKGAIRTRKVNYYCKHDNYEIRPAFWLDLSTGEWKNWLVN